MKIAIIGSRDFKQTDLVEITLIKKIKLFAQDNKLDVEIITGGARGIDTFAEEFAKRNNIPFTIIRPINPANKLDYLFRNVEIVTLADRIIAFWDESSAGSKFTIKYALERNKDIIVYGLSGGIIGNEKLRNLL